MNSVSIQVVKDSFPIQLTLKDDDTAELLARLNSCLNWLKSNGYSQPTSNPPAAAPQPEQQVIPGTIPLCPTHGTQMQKSKHSDGYYCPQKIADDGGNGKPIYCRATA